VGDNFQRQVRFPNTPHSRQGYQASVITLQQSSDSRHLAFTAYERCRRERKNRSGGRAKGAGLPYSLGSGLELSFLLGGKLKRASKQLHQVWAWSVGRTSFQVADAVFAHPGTGG
jgi:hypothetical protein